jgi:hypothetical protein
LDGDSNAFEGALKVIEDAEKATVQIGAMLGSAQKCDPADDQPAQKKAKVEESATAQKPATPVSPKKYNEPAQLKVIQIMSRIRCDLGLERRGVAPDKLPALLCLFKSRLSAFLCEHTQFSRSLDQAITPDRLSGDINVTDMTSVCGPNFRSLHLNFTGPVSEVPTAGALEICTFAGVKFYVRSPKQSDPSTCTEFVTAWSIPVKKKKPDASKPPPLVLNVEQRQTLFRFTYPEFVQVKTAAVDITLFCLKVCQTSGYSQGEKCSLERAPISTMVVKADADVYATKMAKKDAGSNAEGREAKKKFMEEWPFPHLFR